MFRMFLVGLAVAAMAPVASVAAADVTGTWTASFETQVGQQNYTYQFQQKGAELTWTAKSNFGEAKLENGKVDGDTVTFVELLDFQGMQLRIEYTGKVVSADEIKFSRKVADIATEELVAKRTK